MNREAIKKQYDAVIDPAAELVRLRIREQHMEKEIATFQNTLEKVNQERDRLIRSIGTLAVNLSDCKKAIATLAL